MNALTPIQGSGGGQSGDVMVSLIVGEAITWPAHPDADLILACTHFIDLERRIRGLFDGPDAIGETEEAYTALRLLEAKVQLLVSRMEQLRAASPLGIQARAAALAEHNREFEWSFDDRDSLAGSLLDWLMRDALALGAGGVPAGPVDSTDAAPVSTQAGSI